uniref:Secreted protein n=1 Tax=Cacopsylla melanoneura TaxID=428564 RepID=A0A8D8SXS0_9HEMI
MTKSDLLCLLPPLWVILLSAEGVKSVFQYLQRAQNYSRGTARRTLVVKVLDKNVHVWALNDFLFNQICQKILSNSLLNKLRLLVVTLCSADVTLHIEVNICSGGNLNSCSDSEE